LSARLLADIVQRVESASELNKRKVRLFVEAVWNEGRLELIEELVAANYLGRVPRIERGVQGPEGVRRLVACGRRAHPDLYIKIDDQIAEDDRVAMRWRATTDAPVARATTAPTGGTPCYVGISIIRLLAGKQVESHTEYTDVTPSATFKASEDGDSGEPGARPAAPPTARG
jgi:SnoaL-like polyketide cyclase